MRHNTAAAVFLAIFSALGCAGPEANFLGEYSGTFTCGGSWRASGAAYAEGPAPKDVVIDATANGRAFIAGAACTTWIAILSDERGTLSTSTPCSSALEGGGVATVEVTGGVIQRSGNSALTYTTEIVLETPDDTADVVCTFAGSRR